MNIERVVKQLLKPLWKLTAKRENGLKAEAKFWEKWFREKGAQWPEEYAARLSAATPVAGWHKELVDKIDSAYVAILDVGAGPLTVVGKTHPSKTLAITAVDPLADEYDKLISKYGVQPAVRTRCCQGEELATMFGANSFDVVVARNSIDHSEDPMACIASMVEVCRPGGWIGLMHAENEAENEAWRGLHQWNFCQRDGTMIISGRPYSKSVDEEFRGLVEWMHRREGEMIVDLGRKVR